MSAWDRPETVVAWQRFDACSDRYLRVNRAIAQNADLDELIDVPSPRVLDLGAGTGGSAAALLPGLPAGARVYCVEPAAAMRAATSLTDPRVRWSAEPPPGLFDRVVCGSSLWLLGPLPAVLGELHQRLAPGGALVFALPAALLGAVDPAGGGPDPFLDGPVQGFLEGRERLPPVGDPLPDRAGLEAAIAALGGHSRSWEVQTTWTTASRLAWLALPPVAEAMRPDLDLGARILRLARLAAELDHESWRPELWLGWTINR